MADNNSGWKQGSTAKYDVFAAVGSNPHFHYTQDRQTGTVHGTYVQDDKGIYGQFVQRAGSKTHFPVDPANVFNPPFNVQAEAQKILREIAIEKRESLRKSLQMAVSCPGYSLSQSLSAYNALERMGPADSDRLFLAISSTEEIQRMNNNADPVLTRSYRADITRGPSDGYGLPVDYSTIADEVHAAERHVIDAPMAPSIGKLLERGNAGTFRSMGMRGF